MIKTRTVFGFAISAIAVIAGASCQNAENKNTTVNRPANTAPANVERPVNAATPNTSGSTISLATPTDAYKAAYAARKNKDIEGLKRVMSKDIQDFLKMMGEDDKKSLDDMLREMCDNPQAPTNESRNEKITGTTATLEYPDETGKWKTMDFEKIGPDWVMSAPKGPMKPDGPPKKK